MTILNSNGSWCCQGKFSLLASSQLVQQQPITVQSRDTPSPAPGKARNEVDPLECILLYWAIKVTVNPISTPNPALQFRLRRDQSTTLATINFEPLEIGTKAQVLNIPILVGENFDFQAESFGSGTAFFTWLFAGKLGGQPNIIPPPTNGEIGFNANSTLYSQYQDMDLYGGSVGVITNAEILLPFQNIGSESRFATGLDPLDPIISTGESAAGTPGFIKKVRMDITKNTLNKDIKISFFKNGSVLSTIFTILSGQTGSFVLSTNIPIAINDKWSYHIQTTDSINATGNMTLATAIDIEWGTVI